ncbi:DUF1045 domain-containing protein [Sulfitobacter sp. JB4-11]|uniref:DUF1045 domain-containing protein n=1 Tax=Sulfitobacter rhodophyticola TaxID=3238304 RepID=UPI003517B901
MYDRYAIYFTPQGDLAGLGANWLGWDIAQGCAVPYPNIAGLDIAALTETPRKYGLHGTIKPPFKLAPGTTVDALMAETEVLCTTLVPVTLDGLELAALGRFIALIPVGDQSALARMAATVVRTLDPFRATPSEAELAHRRRANLSPAQNAHLARWGYPYVLDQFRFHITLTSKLPKAQVVGMRAGILPIFERFLGQPLQIDSLTLVGERADGMFEEIRRYALTG